MQQKSAHYTQKNTQLIKEYMKRVKEYYKRMHKQSTQKKYYKRWDSSFTILQDFIFRHEGERHEDLRTIIFQ